MKYDINLKYFAVTNVTKKLNKAENRFYAFISSYEPPLTEQKIIDYYSNFVTSQREPKMHSIGSWFDKEKGAWQMGWLEWSDEEIKRKAFAWFDRFMGRFVRYKMVEEFEILTVNKLKAIAN